MQVVTLEPLNMKLILQLAHINSFRNYNACSEGNNYNIISK